MPTRTIKLETTAGRLLIPLLAVICVAGAYIFANWFLADTIALRAVQKEVADLAVEMAPSNPQAHLASAILHEKSFLPEDLPKSLAEFEEAAARSPYDYRLWYELGRARERSGDADGAEKALRRALALAPNYAQVQWTLGNFLLRQGKSDEAFVEIRKAAESDKSFANPAMASASQLFEGDAAALRRYAGDSPNLRAALALVSARAQRFDEALEVWQSLPEDARREDFKTNGEEIYQKMIEAKRYRAALTVFGGLAGSEDKKFAVGQLTNGGFEAENPKNAGVFEWQIADGTEPQIGVDNAQRHGGNMSLKLIFNSGGSAFRGVTQTVAVESNKKYAFEVFYKAELKTEATVKWEIVDAADGKVLAATDTVAANSDWSSLKTEFVVPAATEAVVVRLVRGACKSAACPISGRLWFDDFSLSAR
ncbi:MAG: tetratricopeptide repeat protein [Acidobacteria bacterium]|nr:tetratricopeptide repeat protein [Acidobacteriota bacterium]